MKKIQMIISLALLACSSYAGEYVTNMGWSASNPVTIFPTSGVGPAVSVTFQCSTGYNTLETGTAIGYQHSSGSGDVTVTLSFSSAVNNVKLSIVDLDNPSEWLKNLSPVPDAVTDDLYTDGSLVRSSVNNGHGFLCYDEISVDGSFSFTFKQQLSSLEMYNLQFKAGPTFTDDVKIHTAVELEWFASSGTTYQVQSTSDLTSTNWFYVGDPVIGDNTTNFVLYSTRDETNKYYRVEEVE